MARKKNRKKIPKHGKEPEKGKSVRYSPMDKDGKPVWHFNIMDWDSDWGWRTITRCQMEKILNYLGSIESNTWHEILGGKNHTIKTSDIISAAQKRLRELKQEDIDDLISLRIEGKYRIWGIPDRNILKILWHDPDHLIYPSIKKHT